jgi:hypothetical protein
MMGQAAPSGLSQILWGIADWPLIAFYPYNTSTELTESFPREQKGGFYSPCSTMRLAVIFAI